MTLYYSKFSCLHNKLWKVSETKSRNQVWLIKRTKFVHHNHLQILFQHLSDIVTLERLNCPNQVILTNMQDNWHKCMLAYLSKIWHILSCLNCTKRYLQLKNKRRYRVWLLWKYKIATRGNDWAQVDQIMGELEKLGTDNDWIKAALKCLRAYSLW
jgi:hypothetical protein